MEIVTRLRSADVPQDTLGPLLADYLALDRLRGLRRLLLVRCGSLALATAVLGPLIGWLSALGRAVIVGVFLLPPAWAWILERRADTRLSERLRTVKTESAVPAQTHQAE